MWGQSVVPQHCHSSASSRLPRPNALQELWDIFPEDRQSVLKAAGEHGNWREVLALHVQSVDEIPLEERGESYCNTARAMVGAEQWKRALQLIGDFRETTSPAQFWGGGGEQSVCQLLLSIYSRWGTWPEILKILQEAQVYPDAVTSIDRSRAMRALAKQSSWQSALQIMADTRSAIECDKEMYIAGMNAWVSGHHWRKVFELLQQLQQEDLIPDETVFGRAIAICYRVASSDSDEAASAARAISLLLRDMRQRELSLTTKLWNMAIMSSARNGDPDAALRLLLEVREEPYDASTAPTRSAFDHCSLSCMGVFRRTGNWRSALVLLKEMPAETRSFQEALKACAENGQWQWTMALMQQMQELGPDLHHMHYMTYASVIGSFSVAQQWQLALWTLDLAELSEGGKDAGVKSVSSVSLYNKVITAFVNEGEWQKALWLLQDMPEREVLPNVITYGAVAKVCNSARQYLYSLQLHEDMMRKDIDPDISSFKTAVAACRGKMKSLLQAAQPGKSRRQKLL